VIGIVHTTHDISSTAETKITFNMHCKATRLEPIHTLCILKAHIDNIIVHNYYGKEISSAFYNANNKSLCLHSDDDFSFGISITGITQRDGDDPLRTAHKNINGLMT